MAAAEKVTQDQASDALHQLMLNPDDQEPTAVSQVAEEPAAAESKAEPEAETQETQAATPEAAEAEGDDVASLKQRLTTAESERKTADERAEKRLQALQHRNAENERILRDRYLRKSTVADKAYRVLKASRSQEGVPEADVDSVIREIESTVNPMSATYAPPPEPRPAATEDQAIVLNTFLNEKGMTMDEAEEFGNWIRADATKVLSPAEQAIAGRDIDGFLRVAHSRWQDGMRQKEKEVKRSDAVEAVRSVQRTQKEAARAAAATTAAPKKQPAGPKAEIDPKKLTKDDISTLLRQSVEQYR